MNIEHFKMDLNIMLLEERYKYLTGIKNFPRINQKTNVVLALNTHDSTFQKDWRIFVFKLTS